ncbi:MAG TPA: tRNA 2-thiouridine(34) synthase MnmA, partial [Planctomycetota bacterium]|nr:tRNA 2-thiouridine(34) synthase MnmA [Planctomycetota bacterium]
GIIRNFVDEYNAGRTPNPCVLCNRDLKFGRLLQFADRLGIPSIATGHYARLEPRSGRTALLRARDERKDQTYMLFALSQAQLLRTRFPLGGLEKPEVRAIAREAGLSIADKPESQEICFVPNGDYRELLRARAPEAFGAGQFRTLDGAVIGSHGGHQNFTVGQRRGLGVASGRRMYVVRIEPETNTVVLGDEDELGRREMTVARVNWVSIETPAQPIAARVRIRHGHTPVPARIASEAGGRARVTFDVPQKIVTPGQAAVFYDEDLVLGGGWIE